ncbi:aminoacyl-tRNA hydrolase [Mycoplasma iguanae]|uniref:Peptidyl-tRNA hydrolase n=1 Tax=Mycoplasma iguanae TaxID=292461 RepID=A0ABY5R8V2_9MOLU|nr:aminoacyl-tRNA hydrolase [Mycoplasma iguanae]UVD81746.1 aminoacyl-tRNA hydrolase [Mycoplasma iguanae]
MKLIIGLGNPGEKYQNTKHNIGFNVVDLVAKKLNVKLKKTKFSGYYYKGDDFILAKPMTFMNLSGNFVQPFVNFFKIKKEDILIISDDVDHKIGQAVIKTKGSSGGQNGLKSIFEQMGTSDIARLKIGISRPHGNKTMSSYVLSPFSKINQPIIDNIINYSAEIIIAYLEGENLGKLINTFNEKYKKNIISS